MAKGINDGIIMSELVNRLSEVMDKIREKQRSGICNFPSKIDLSSDVMKAQLVKFEKPSATIYAYIDFDNDEITIVAHDFYEARIILTEAYDQNIVSNKKIYTDNQELICLAAIGMIALDDWANEL